MKKLFIVIYIFVMFSFVFSDDVTNFVYYSRVNDLESSEEYIYCATNNGLIFYNKYDEKFENKNISEINLAGHNINSIIKNGNTGNIISFTNKGVYCLEANRYWSKISEKYIKIKSYLVEGTKLYLKSTNNKIYLFENYRLQSTDTDITKQFTDKYSKKKYFPKFVEEIEEKIEIKDYEKIDNFKYIIITNAGYMLIYNQMRQKYIFNLGSVYDNKLTDIFYSKNNIFFIGERINQYDGKRFKFYDFPKLRDNINDVKKYGYNSLLIATKTNGIFYYRDKLKNLYRARDGLLSNNIRKLRISKKHIIVLTKHGITIIKRGTNQMEHLKGIDYFNVKNIDIDGNILAMQKKDRVIIYNLKNKEEIEILAEELFNEIIMDIFLKNGKLYIGGNLGIGRYNITEDRLNSLYSMNSAANYIFVKDNYIYIATDNGLFIYNLKNDEMKVVDKI